jgi:hypothetical protein
MSSDDEGSPIYDSGSGWKPEKVEYSSTDTPDYFQEDPTAKVDGVSVPVMDGGNPLGTSGGGTTIDGLVDFSSNPDTVIGGYEPPEGLPDGVELKKPANGIYNAEFPMKFAAQGAGDTAIFSIPPEAMTFEPFWAGFTTDSHPMFSVEPVSGTMDNRRGGEATEFTITATPNGANGVFEACLVVVLPEDNEEYHFKITADSY